jgi:hypothetical protein
MPRDITVLHVPGCSGGTTALAVAAEIAQVDVDVSVTEVVIEDGASAAAHGFRGSPTVLIDGREMAPDPEVPLGSMG